MNDLDPFSCFNDLKPTTGTFVSADDIDLSNLPFPIFEDSNALENAIFIKEEQHHDLAESITRSSKFDLSDEFENCMSDLAGDLAYKNEFSSDESLTSPTIIQDINFAYNSILEENSVEAEVPQDEPGLPKNVEEEEEEKLDDETTEEEESEEEEKEEEVDTQPPVAIVSPECPGYIPPPQYVLVVQPVVPSVPQVQPVQQKLIPNNKTLTQINPVRKFPRFRPYKPLLHIAPKKKERRRQKRLKIKLQIEKYKKIAPKPSTNVQLKVSPPQPQIIVPLLKVLTPSELPRTCATVTSNALSEVVAQVPSTASVVNTQQQACPDIAALSRLCRICGQNYTDVIASQMLVPSDQLPLAACLTCCSKLQQDTITAAASVATTVHLQEKTIIKPIIKPVRPEPTPIGSAISVKLPQEYMVLQDLDTTAEYLDSIPPDPPYKCSVTACPWNSKSDANRSDMGDFKDHYNQDHKVDLCEYCLKVFATSDKKYQHVQKWHIIPCRICGSEFLGYEKLNTHLVKRHRPYAPPPEDTTKEFQCKFCLQVLYRKRRLEKHYEEKHEIFPCSRCFQLFNTTEQRLNHEFEIHEAICLLCKSSVSSEKSMKKHITVQHKQQRVSDINIFRFPRVDNPLYECKFCKRELSTNLNVIYHYYWFHKKIGCEFCLAAFQTREQEYEHYKDTHTLECIYCNKKFSNVQDLQIHIDDEHQGQMSWFCEYCGTPCNDREMLNEHRKSHNNEENSDLLLCYVCGYQSINQATFISHKKIHDKPKNDDHSCKICNRSFKKPGGLKLHITLKHTGKVTEKNFQCKICKKHFASMSILTLHKKRHSKYTCNICGIQYLFKLHLDEHVQEIHSRCIAYKCRLCSKMLCKESEIKLHLQGSHNQYELQNQAIEIVDVLRCQLCNNLFSNKKLILAHIKEQHIQDKKIVKICRNKPRGRKPYLVRVQKNEEFM